jgi:pimeloyl-ACP methyl ester carboxylesterase
LKIRLEGSLDQSQFEVRFHAYDWRRDVTELGQAAILHSGEPAYIVGHSMGGLVARAAAAPGMPGGDLIKQVIMLGTPNFGSFAPVQAMRGTLEMLAFIVGLDPHHDTAFYRRELFMTFPGLYDMLPAASKTGSLDFFDQGNWPADDFRPPKDHLDQARKVQTALFAGDSRFFLIAGVEEDTVVAAQLAGNEFTFTASLAGDGTVPLSCCLLGGVPTYYVPGHVPQKHMQLPALPKVMEAIFDIIQTGRTNVLPDTWTAPHKEVTLSEGEIRTQVTMVAPVARSVRTTSSQSDRRRMLRSSYLETVPAALRR